MDAIKENPVVNFNMKLVEMSMENMKKTTEMSVEYMRNLEKLQRDFVKSGMELFSKTFAGESKLWGMQTEAMEKMFQNVDKCYDNVSKAWK
ncbi:MAG: hypothetical protein U0457_09985 [Candidatus Sericytochromatia bacterium]